MDGGHDPFERAPLLFHDVCARYGITPRTLRHYESIEILAPTGQGRNKTYDARQQVRLELTLKGRRFRLPLEQIRQIIELYDAEGPDAQTRRWRTVIAHHRREVAAEIDILTRMLEEMDTILQSPERAE